MRRGWAMQRAAAAMLAVGSLCPALVSAHAWTSNTVLFEREIVRILNERCVACHSAGGASFALETYEQTWLRRNEIHDRILARHMPPWAAVPGFGRFANDNALTLRETRFIVSWVEGLGPRNAGRVFLNVLDAGASPPAEVRAAYAGAWRLGDPDLTVPMAEIRPATGAARVVIDIGLDSARALSALEYRPAGRSALRAVVFSLETTGQWLATWTPWHGMRRLPDGAAFRLDPGSRIVAHVVTHEAAENFVVAGELGLHFAGQDATTSPHDTLLIAEGPVAAGAAAHPLTTEMLLEEDVEILALWPEPVEGVGSLEVSARHPDGRVQVLLLALDIPLAWPTSYLYESPVRLPAGTRVRMTGYADNAAPTPIETRVILTISAMPSLDLGR